MQRLAKKLLLPVAVLALNMPFCAYAQKGVVVQTEGGALQGIHGTDPKISAFLGIPYAAPPVGDLRWRAPQPAAKWTGIRRADHFGASCMQHTKPESLPWTKEFFATEPVSENCLYLNVWTGDLHPKQLMPVVVWIHGGGFTQGSASAPIINGEQVAKQGVLYVSINYRLGIEGFFALPELSAESSHHASGNYGLMDMIAALEWTKRNIHAFGGDPDKVTIAGQSAGASAMEFLAASPLAKGLFRGEIIESGAIIGGPSANFAEDQEKLGTQYAAFTKLPTLKELRGLSETDLQNMQAHAHLKFVPSIDGYVVPARPSAVFAAGQQNDVPTIDGMVADEGSSHEGYGQMTAEEFAKSVHASRHTYADQFLQLYPCSTQAECTASQKAYERDRRLVSMYLWGVERAKTAKTPVYTYVFTHPIPWPEHPEYAVFHCTEMPYWMRTLKVLPRPYTPKDFALSDTVSSYWIHFIKTGSPNSAATPVWSELDPAKPLTMDLGDNLGMRPVVVEPERFKLWMTFLQSLHFKN